MPAEAPPDDEPVLVHPTAEDPPEESGEESGDGDGTPRKKPPVSITLYSHVP